MNEVSKNPRDSSTAAGPVRDTSRDMAKRINSYDLSQPIRAGKGKSKKKKKKKNGA